MNRRQQLKTFLALGSAPFFVGSSLAGPNNVRLKRIATEEHFLLPDYISAVNKYVRKNPDAEKRAWLGKGIKPLGQYALMGTRIADFEHRLELMDRDQIDMQVLSLMQPGVQIFEPKEASAIATEVNNQVFQIVKKQPNRFSALATIAPQSPKNAARELERAITKLDMKGAVINSHTKSEYLDNEKYWPIFEAAESLEAPIYLHPREPIAGMYEPSNYGGLHMIWGFGADTSLHALRLILSGLFDRFPRLRIVLGHLGEGIPFALERIDDRFAAMPAHYKSKLPRKIKRKPSEYFKENFVVTSSGQNWKPAVQFCQQVLGEDKVMFGADYPFEDQSKSVKTADAIPMEENVKQKFFHGNAERIFRLK